MSDNNTEIIRDISTIMSVELPAAISFQQLEERLAAYINELIKRDFEKLVFILYRVDVFENKLKELLKLNADEDAGRTIAKLIIERQLQKIKSRQQFKRPPHTNDTEEKW
ncbi:MAG: hypothetical protein ABJA78_01930 [Ferruginibacter sp.]